MVDHMYDDTTGASTSTEAPEPSQSDDNTKIAEPVGIGPLLEKDEEATAKLVNSFWNDTDDMMAEKLSHWKANEKRREGVIGVHVVKPDPDRAEWKVWAPPGAARVPPTFNQPARLSRRLVSNLFVDPPIPEATPGGASDNDDPDAAEFTTRILQDVATSEHFNVPAIGEECLDLACTFDSAFARVYVDPKGGGSRPRTIIASEAATTVADALYVDGDDETPQPTPYVTRYVKEGDELTDDPRLAELEWLPGLRYEPLTGRNLRPIPSTATTIENASGVVIRSGTKLGKLRDQFPQLNDLTLDEQWELVGQRPDNSDEALTKDERAKPTRKRDEEEPPPDDSTVVTTSVYMGAGGEYPAGAYVVVAGNKRLLHRQKWEAEVNGLPEPLPLPIAHFKGWSEGKRTFYGYHLMHFLGPGNEVRAAALGGAIEHLDRFNRRKVFYTPQSLFQPKSGTAATGVMVPVQQGSEPRTEDIPDWPNVGMEIFDRATAELNDESGLLPIAQGMADPSVTSGLHAQKVIEQVNIGLGSIKHSTERGVTSLWKIAVAFIRAYYTIPQQIRYRGDDQEYKQKDWSAVDLGDTKDVRILKGSFSMLAPSAKLSVAEYMRKLNLITDDQLRMMAQGNVGGLMGLQDDPALLRIRRQISLWEDGPPKAENPSEAMPDQYPGETALEEPQNAPMEGMSDPSVIGAIPPAMEGEMPPEGMAPPVPQGPPPPPPNPFAEQLANVFRASPNDEEPAIAQIRFRELSRAMCSKKYERQPEPWRLGFDAEYQKMRKAAGVGTAAESAQGQQAAQQAQQQAEQQKQQAEMQAEQAALQGKSQSDQALANLEAQHELQLEQLKMQHESEMKQAELAGKSVADPMMAAENDIEKKRIEIEAKMTSEKAKLDQDYELAVMKMQQDGALAKAKMTLDVGGEVVGVGNAVKKTVVIHRGEDGFITSAEIIPEETDPAPQQREA